MHLVLFFTHQVSLRAWADNGMFEREVALYRALQKRGIHISFITYGDRRDLEFAPQLPGIEILCNQWRLPLKLYTLCLPWLHARALKTGDIFKTNQTSGADIALRCAQRYQKPLVARCGYLWSNFTARQAGQGSREHHRVQALEAKVFGAAHKVVVTTPRMAKTLATVSPEITSRLEIIPNYVETERFRPIPEIDQKFDLIFVGRLTPQKNVTALLSAIEGLDVRLHLIGDGELKQALQHQFAHLAPQVTWQSKVANADLPTYFNQAKVFILPSLYEGHPKALIEAMACGLTIIATRVQGIQDMIAHGKTGWLCNTDSVSIRGAIQHLMAQPELCHQVGRAARQYVLDHYALDRVLHQEEEMLIQVLDSCNINSNG